MIVNKLPLAHGIDVSNNNWHFPWNQWRDKLHFGMAKAGEGTHFADELFAENWQAMRDLGLWRFAYHYIHPLDSPPHVQAQFFTDLVRRQDLRPHDHFVADIETTEMPPDETSWWMWVFCKEMNRMNMGHRIIPYTYVSYADQGYTAKLGSWHLWEAAYDVSSPPPCGPWRDWTFWQYTGSGLDLNVFNGTPAALEKFCQTTG